ncbi:hypothetical protein B0H13DRAFT_1853241 [Mycena leptocephala]|nr:hypothetical protein B0H13DRAFT_1853241 [Mycena leptocephala]
MPVDSPDDASRLPLRDDPFVSLTADEKNNVRVPWAILRKMTARHAQISASESRTKLKSVEALRTEFLAHRCAEACLVLKSEAILAGLSPNLNILSLSELQQCELKLGLRSNPQKRKSTAADDNVHKRPRLSVDPPFPIILCQDEKDEIVREFRQAADDASLKRYECSFYGTFEKASYIRMRAVNKLDISLLNKAVAELRVISRQPRIEPFDNSSLVSGSYVLCHLSNSAVIKNSFRSIPLRSYANSLWIGKLPEEVKDRKNNVLRAPDRRDDTTSVVSAMPIPLFRLRDEICVILVGSPDTEVTQDMLKDRRCLP